MKEKWNISSEWLHIIAMACMLCDHIWGMLLPDQEWLTCIGRIAFPIFAFMIAEGYRHTKNLNRYMLRLLVCAIISEIPFNLMVGANIVYPYHQNVIWTFLIGIIIIKLIDKVNRIKAVSTAIILLGFIAGYVMIADYYGVGVLTVVMFYYLHKQKWYIKISQFVSLYVLNIGMLGGYCYVINLFGHDFEVPQQAFALFALIPIWLYNGKRNTENKAFSWCCYIFYPAHMLILYIIAMCIV